MTTTALYDHDRLRVWRVAAGLTRHHVANATGLGYNTICRLEQGDGDRSPTLATLTAIAQFYGHDVRELLPGAA